jgi:peptide-N4-(N-acetyl-beta-glucosaminyl)asparagine amidase
MLPNTEAVTVGSYALTAANDAPERDPAAYVLEAFNEETGVWDVLDERTGLRFLNRGERLRFQLKHPARPACQFRLRVMSVADPRAANSVQLACLDLFITS